MKRLLYVILVWLSGIEPASAKVDFPLKTGMWRAVLQLNDSIELPFNIEVKNGYMEVINAEERIRIDSVIFKANPDSLNFVMPVFDSEFRCRLDGDSLLEGVWINRARKTKNVIPFKARYGENYRIWPRLQHWNADISGRWEVTFSPGKSDSTKAVGIFRKVPLKSFKEGKGITRMCGTFLTETGDYRYLEGASMDWFTVLTCFDGAHAFLFKFRSDLYGEVRGDFYSGSHWHQKWIAKRNDKFELRNPDSLTFLKPGYDKIDFQFKNLEGKTVSLQDEKFKNKVVIVQLMGSWCPNCMDETKFLSELYKKYKNMGVEIIALAFEKDTAFAKAKSLLERLKKKYNIGYEILITQKTGKDQASSVLPMLNSVMAFPTTIFIDKKGRVRKIYTGFTGPGTGHHYDKLVDETRLFLDKLIKE
jgi:thiol-disulfide isomerase/thioredoxin